MINLGEVEPSDETRREHEEETRKILKNAAYTAAIIWITPVILNLFRRKQN